MGSHLSISKWPSRLRQLSPIFATVPIAVDTGSYSREGLAMRETNETDVRPNAERPQMWVGCLGCLNAGRLVGDWFDAEDCPTDMAAFEASGIYRPWPHFAEVHEELWVFDHQGFGEVLTGECPPVEARRLALLIEEASDRGIPAEALAYWLRDGHDSDDADELLDGLQDAFCGLYDSGADYARDLAEDVGAVPQDGAWPLYCIDWERAWRELEYGGDNYAVEALDGGFLIFRGC